MLLYYITDSLQFSAAATESRGRLLENIAEAARCGVDVIQLRERHLTPRELEKLALDSVEAIRKTGAAAKLLINSRIDIAIAAGADGVHLRSDRASELSASEARNIFHKAGVSKPIIAVSCHTLEDVYSAEAHGADFAVFGPVFGKVIAASQTSAEKNLPGVGPEQLRAACEREAAASSRMPVLALGGITLANAQACLDNGAAGIAAIRLFQPDDIGKLAAIVTALRVLQPVESKGFKRRHPYQG